MRIPMIKLSIVALAVLVCAPAFSQTAPELQSHVEYLASDALQGRAPASEGMGKAIEYVKAQCKELGLQTYSQPVPVRGGTCSNTVAVLEGRSKDVRIVVGAHLDHLGTASRVVREDDVFNGADDNASGCAAVLGLARRLSGEAQIGCTVEFHWYTGEEQGLLGSKVYCKKPLAPIEQYKAMVNLDMVGRLDREKMIGDAPFPYTATLTSLADKYIFAERITRAWDTASSDHSSWWRAGVPAVILHTGLHADYHKVTDEAAKIDYRGMVDVCDYAYDIVKAIDKIEGGPSPPAEPEDPFVLY